MPALFLVTNQPLAAMAGRSAQPSLLEVGSDPKVKGLYKRHGQSMVDVTYRPVHHILAMGRQVPDYPIATGPYKYIILDNASPHGTIQ